MNKYELILQHINNCIQSNTRFSIKSISKELSVSYSYVAKIYKKSGINTDLLLPMNAKSPRIKMLEKLDSIDINNLNYRSILNGKCIRNIYDILVDKGITKQIKLNRHKIKSGVKTKGYNMTVVNYGLMEQQLKRFETDETVINIKIMQQAGTCSNKTVHTFLKNKGYQYSAKTGWTKTKTENNKLKICYV